MYASVEHVLGIARELSLQSSKPELCDRLISHLKTTGEIAQESALDILRNNPELSSRLDPQESHYAGLVHDIGRPLDADQRLHELRGAQYLRENARKQGIVTEQSEALRLAWTIESHGFVHEVYGHMNGSSAKDSFPSAKERVLYTASLQEAIVAYADMLNCDGARVTFDERIERGREKFRMETLPASVIDRAISRLSKVHRDISDLRSGKRSFEEIGKYDLL
jgi:hypothetical protein